MDANKRTESPRSGTPLGASQISNRLTNSNDELETVKATTIETTSDLWADTSMLATNMEIVTEVGTFEIDIKRILAEDETNNVVAGKLNGVVDVVTVDEDNDNHTIFLREFLLLGYIAT
ncbi:hypothetical protein K2173_028577 [Erythroxylum novogranatense]|uniref:Uncharacterized protein n=1 Tax=Erythroxylum novogranatense TaxID=1862640 RepID=A0AAV8U638_9ROSI|nr:hypothetical protein K2173_028577 [Erythroxylum novogranatense]